MFFTLLKLYKWYQIAQSITYRIIFFIATLKHEVAIKYYNKKYVSASKTNLTVRIKSLIISSMSCTSAIFIVRRYPQELLSRVVASSHLNACLLSKKKTRSPPIIEILSLHYQVRYYKKDKQCSFKIFLKKY